MQIIYIIYTSHINLGSFHIISDIAKVFGIDLITAEKLKVLYSNAILSSFDKDSIINLEDLQIDSLYNLNAAITIYKLTEIIGPRKRYYQW
ncbi:Cell division protein FtsA [Rickettsia monacensis]|uniref:Cell division protein FtsA n=1 Tax=Rickettsia monacensis TaxID=109232 RepID=A0A0B7IXB2_9RICK|nr:cell division protein FtsA [Rickettsia monacensis IrR/Munich]CEO16456.1 Cell division protein FtsA [Rickettsia monacensis]